MPAQQLLAPASRRRLEIAHHLVRLQQPICRGSFVRRQYFNPLTSQVLSHNNSIIRSSIVQSLYSSIDISARSIETLDDSWKLHIDWAEPRVLLCGDVMINLSLKKDINQNMKFKSVYANFICDGDDSSRSAIFKDRSLSKVLIGHLFVIFDRSSWSRSMKSSSIVLVDSLFTTFNRNSRSRSVEGTSRVLVHPSSIAVPGADPMKWK
nr:rab escort protein 1 isoform X1 [Ipomoea trifida]